MPVPRCFNLFERNLETVFFTTLGLVRATRSGSNVSRISRFNQVKKKGVFGVANVEIWAMHDE